MISQELKQFMEDPKNRLSCMEYMLGELRRVANMRGVSKFMCLMLVEWLKITDHKELLGEYLEKDSIKIINAHNLTEYLPELIVPQEFLKQGDRDVYASWYKEGSSEDNPRRIANLEQAIAKVELLLQEKED